MAEWLPIPKWDDNTVADGTDMNAPATALEARTDLLKEHTPTPFVPGESYALNRRVQLDNGDIVTSTIDGNTNDPNVDMTGWVGESNEIIYASKYGLNNDSNLDQSAKLQSISDIAKSGSRMLVIDSLSEAIYAVMNVDITGLQVEVSPSVSFIAPPSSTNEYTFIAAGTSGNLGSKTVLKNAHLDTQNRMKGVFYAEYVSEPQAHDCTVDNENISAVLDGMGVQFKECYKPRVIRGFYKGGRYGVMFNSCTNPVAQDVETKGQGRDGILFYTSINGTTTTDAVADNCTVSEFSLNGDEGRGGIHFYGVRRATAIAPTVSQDGLSVYGTGKGSNAVRFRDCEDFSTVGYEAHDIDVGVIANEVGDYADAPHNIISRGSIGSGNVKDCRNYGIAAATPDRVCNIVGAVVDTVGGSSQPINAGIYSSADGSISGNTVKDTDGCAGIRSSGNNTITGNNLKNAGASGFGQVTVDGKEAVVSGNSFENSDGTSGAAIRGQGSAKLTIGSNSYGVGITIRVATTATATIKKDSSMLVAQFSGYPSTTGIFENGVILSDAGGTIYIREGGIWKRQTPRVFDAVVGASQTSIAHGLGYTPTQISLTPQSNANIWQSATADATNIYLTSSVASTNVRISCR